MGSSSNKVFIATSIDGYIADKDGKIDWLDSIPELNTIDTGYATFTADIDALVMGRVTFETICSFDIDWPYTKPVFVLSQTLEELPIAYHGKVFLVKGSLNKVLDHIHQLGYLNLYIDGGRLIQSFLKEDLIDEMIITVIPIILGGGHSLFSDNPRRLNFECIKTTLFLEKVVQNHFVRMR